jgi:hypothetical protein
MKMQQNVLRKIARSQVERYCVQFPADVRNDLEVSLVRQWTTNDGKAVLIFSGGQLWFTLERHEDSFHVGTVEGERVFARQIQEQFQLDPEEMPELLHRLNCTQSVALDAPGGRKFSVSLDYDSRSLRFEEILVEP